MHTWIEIDTKAIKHNLAEFKKILGKNKLLMPVVKANAYGHGMIEVAKICDAGGRHPCYNRRHGQMGGND